MPDTAAPPPVLLFDLDGTLVHSVPDLRVAANKLLAEDGRRALSDDEVQAMVGNGVRKLVERCYRATGGLPDGDLDSVLDALVPRFMVHYDAHPADLTRPFDGAVAALESLRAAGHRMAVVTNKPTEAARAILDQLDLARFFDVLIGGGSTAFLKPHPEPVRAALRLLEADAADAIFVGDSENDVGAARAAGLAVVCLSFGYRHCPAESLGGDALIDHFDALPQAVETVRKRAMQKA
ncbi:phosphoglycolate phosphatase [Novispirillum sp. DQ9]|uniref:phosphoglycolate phosphatase n=1 Tax=Novispirillum sp. DQ9 TaxID=3398612 RepID=UPI003C7C574B